MLFCCSTCKHQKVCTRKNQTKDIIDLLNKRISESEYCDMDDFFEVDLKCKFYIYKSYTNYWNE